jgi:hypothetical protein
MSEPAAVEYDALDVHLEPAADGYRVRVRSRGSADASGLFALPFGDDRVEATRLRLDPSRGRTRGRRSEHVVETAREFGGELFRALIADEDVRDVVRGAARAAEATAPRRGLRMTLHLDDAPELAAIPWELLYDEPRFLSQSVWTPIVRYVDLPRPQEPLPVRLPLRILGMISAPQDPEWAELDTERERRELETALRPLVATGAVEVEWLPQATLRAVQHAVDHGGDFHVFHYIGHGWYDERAEAGRLVLEGDDGRARYVSGEDIGQLLCDRSTLRLAVLNACEAATTPRDPLAGVASSLLHLDVPAVVAMQTAITDEAAIVFAGELYRTLAAGEPIDAATAVARRALAAATRLEWATPVLFMRVRDGRLFDVVAGAAAPPDVPQPAVPAPPPAAEPDPERDLEPLLELAVVLDTGNATARREADRAVREIALGVPISALLDLALHGDRGERAAAAVALGAQADARPRILLDDAVRSALHDLFDDASARVRYRAVRAVRKAPPGLLRSYADDLVELARSDPNADVEAAAQKIVVRLGL